MKIEIEGDREKASLVKWKSSELLELCPFGLGIGDKGHFGSYLKLCDFTLLFMTLQVELRLNKRILSETQTN